MAKVILGVTISLDGFAEDSNGSVGALYPDLDTLRNTEVLKESICTTGSVVMAWKEFAMAEDPDWFAGNYEYQVPIFVFTDKAPKKHPKETDKLTFTFVTDGVKSAIRQAKAAAGDKNVTKTLSDFLEPEKEDITTLLSGYIEASRLEKASEIKDIEVIELGLDKEFEGICNLTLSDYLPLL